MTARRIYRPWDDDTARTALAAVKDDSRAWLDFALCAEVGGTEFYAPEHGEIGWTPDAAKAICAKCPVADECLSFALDNMNGYNAAGQWGIWAGTTPEDRRKMLRRAA